MRILVGQPYHETGIRQISELLEKNNDVQLVLFPEGYLNSEAMLGDASTLAQKYKVVIVTSFKDSGDGKDIATLIDNAGEVLFIRQKTPENGDLLLPSLIYTGIGKIGYMLCREIFLDYSPLKEADLILNPIGVGMFSDEQFVTWSTRGKFIAETLNVPVIGTSHADGFYRDSKISIPIAYYYDEDGREILLSKSDIRARIIDLETKQTIFV
jgi:predicted amidohydrolase